MKNSSSDAAFATSPSSASRSTCRRRIVRGATATPVWASPSMSVVDHVAQHDRGVVGPGREPQRRQVRDEVDVAVALLPARERVARHRLHLHVDREEVVADVRSVVDGIQEEAQVEPLAQQAAVEIGEREDDRVERSVGRSSAQVVDPECHGLGL